jgi:hypothetical protein
VGNLSGITDNRSAVGSQSFSYDNRDRLICWKLNATSVGGLAYLYDANGSCSATAAAATPGMPRTASAA